jgi:hypothetical protein
VVYIPIILPAGGLEDGEELVSWWEVAVVTEAEEVVSRNKDEGNPDPGESDAVP